jgi:ABC-type transport system substrate-binding protein
VRGGQKGGGGGGGGDINVALTSFPDYVDPKLSYTLEGWEVLWNVYTPLLTYKHAKGNDGTQVVPALAEKMPDISPDDNTGDITIELTEPNGTFENVLGLMFAAPVPRAPPWTRTPPTIRRPPAVRS